MGCKSEVGSEVVSEAESETELEVGLEVGLKVRLEVRSEIADVKFSYWRFEMSETSEIKSRDNSIYR